MKMEQNICRDNKNVCVVCGSADSIALSYAGILKCRKCGHMFSNLRMDDKELSKLYGTKYFFGDEYNNYLEDKRPLQKNFKARLKTLQTFIEPSRHRHLLEIGCAYGFFLDMVSKLFSTAQGIDISKDAICYAHEHLKLNVINADFLEHDFGTQKFNVICMWDTIEHLQDPHFYLEKISRHTETGSLVAITTGDAESVNARIRKNKWRLLHPPTHIHYFSRYTLSKMLDKYGFEVIYNQYCGFYRSIDSIAYKTLTRDKKGVWLYNLLHKSVLAKMDFYLNLYDIMYVIARKR